MQPLWMGGFSWLAMFLMLGASLLWLALPIAGAWLFIKWAGRGAARLDDAARRMERARDDLLRARDTVSAASSPAAPALPTGGQRAISSSLDGVKRL